jgi:hypothetical protein
MTFLTVARDDTRRDHYARDDKAVLFRAQGEILCARRHSSVIEFLFHKYRKAKI